MTDRPTCRKCGGPMAPGVALEQTYTSAPYMGEVVTLSPGGPGRLVPVEKCAACGWSVTAAR